MTIEGKNDETPACIQCRRGPEVGPGPAQTWRISGFVKPKIAQNSNAVVWSEK